jgi:hypothetical protein
MSAGNGQLERAYYCSRCGQWLCATTVPLGTPGSVTIECSERNCGLPNVIRIGEQPIPAERRQAARDAWIGEIELQRRRRRATQF